MRPSLTALSQTGESNPDTDALTGLPTDPDLHNRTPADSPDTRHETTDQKAGGSSPSERAKVNPTSLLPRKSKPIGTYQVGGGRAAVSYPGTTPSPRVLEPVELTPDSIMSEFIWV
jgi:hypothetical protein